MPMFPQFEAVDREVIWAALFAWFKGLLTAAAWVPLTAYVTGDIRLDSNGHRQKAQNNGTSGAAAPVWNAAGGSTTDGKVIGTPVAVVWHDLGPAFTSMGRRHVMPPQLTPAEQPAFFQVAGKETNRPQFPPGAPAKLILHGVLIVYAFDDSPIETIGDEQKLAETTLNNLLKAIDTALIPDDTYTGKFTIGGLVQHCWIEGDCDLDPGIFGPQAAAILPLHILV